jgi:hypothetical protein
MNVAPLSPRGRKHAPHWPDACRRCHRRDFNFARRRDHADGACLSACTLAIGILPRGQVCATPNAVLGFHAAWRPTANGGRVTSPDVTQAMYEVYPANVRKWIARRGGLSGRLILLKGRELAAMVPACEPDLRSHPTTCTVRRDLLPRATLAAQQKR